MDLMSKIQEFLKNQEKSVMSSVEGKTIIDYFNNNAEEFPEYPALNTPINSEYTGWDSVSWSAYRAVSYTHLTLPTICSV